MATLPKIITYEEWIQTVNQSFLLPTSSCGIDMLMAVSDPLCRITAGEKPIHNSLDAPAREASSWLRSTDPNWLKAQFFSPE
jgi:hypothetical protein